MTLELLQKFCATDPLHTALQRPYKDGKWTCATDGRIAIRTAADLGVTETGGPSLNVVLPPSSASMTLAEVDWDDVRAKNLEWNQCKGCEGSGYVVDCPECDGLGEEICESCGHEEDCDKCNGSGLLPWKNDPPEERKVCEACGGQKGAFVQTPYRCNSHGLHADLKYLKLIAELPAPRLYYKDSRSAMRFEYDGGEGALMPLLIGPSTTF